METRSTVRNIVLFLFLSFTISFSIVTFGAQDSTALKLTILHMNDPHAHYDPFEIKGMDAPIGGFAKAQTVIASLREECEKEKREVLTLMAGDLLMGTPYSAVFKGRLGVRLMNEMRFDVMAVGNHEFGYGKNHLLETLRPLMKFPLLSANIADNNGDRLFEHVVTRAYPDRKARVMIFGLTTADTPTMTMPDNVTGLVFHDPIKAAQEFLAQVDERDLVIALTHLGIDADRDLAQACPKIDVIIGGHSHTAIPVPEKRGDTLISQAGAYAQYVGRLDLEVIDGKIVSHRGGLISLGPEVKEDPATASVIAEHRARLDIRLGDQVGRTEVFLDGTLTNIRSGRTTNLGKLITYTMASTAGTEVALINGGAIRASLKEGRITLEDIYTVLPFQDTLVKLTLPGADLEEILQRSEDLPSGSGGKLQSYGLSFQLNDGKVKITKIRDRAFEPAKYYTVAINNFLMAGGDGYVIFKHRGNNPQDTGVLLTAALIDFLKKRGTVTGRILSGLQS